MLTPTIITPQMSAPRRMALQNQVHRQVWDIDTRVQLLESQSGSAGFDPGDLTVYYENGKA